MQDETSPTPWPFLHNRATWPDCPDNLADMGYRSATRLNAGSSN